MAALRFLIAALIAGDRATPVLGEVRRWLDRNSAALMAVVLLVLWLLGVFVFKITAGLIHLVLVVAIVVGLIQLFTGRRA